MSSKVGLFADPKGKKRNIPNKNKKAVKEFENIIEMAELRALSKLSLKQPLNDKQFKRMMELGRKQGYRK